MCGRPPESKGDFDGVLHQVGVPVPAGIQPDFALAVGVAEDDRHGSSLAAGAAQAVPVIALVRDEILHALGARQQGWRDDDVSRLARGQGQREGRPTTSVSACSLVVWPPRDGPMA